MNSGLNPEGPGPDSGGYLMPRMGSLSIQTLWSPGLSWPLVWLDWVLGCSSLRFPSRWDW
eukprot:2042041-Heterocapsa_arctica.AAC.1